MTPIILVIDDNPGVAYLVQQAVQDWPEGGRVLAATNGTKAVSLFRAHLDQIVLVVLDYHMPGIDGWETCALLRTLSPTVPILPYTTTFDSLLQLRDLGCLPVLTKQATMNNPALLGKTLRQALHSTVPPVNIAPATRARVEALVAEKTAALIAICSA